MRAWSRWRGGRLLALFFAATVVLPSLALAVLAYRAVDSDRRLAEKDWNERMQDAVRRAYAGLELRSLKLRARAGELGRGAGPGQGAVAGTLEAALSQVFEVSPASGFAWVPDGHLPAGPAPPRELQDAEDREARWPASQAVSEYDALLQGIPTAWRGRAHLRLAGALARAGEMAASRAELRRVADLPDSPGPAPSRFAARFELAAGSPEEAAALYRDLSSGAWLLEKSPYAFYQMKLREWAGGRISPETLAAERVRRAMSAIAERALHGESGWLKDGSVAALVTTASQVRTVALITPESTWRAWLGEAAKEAPRDIAIRAGVAPPDPRLAPVLSLAPLGLPWSIWSEPRDPLAAARANDGRRRMLLSILALVAGVLLFGSFATARLVRRELKIAQLQSDFTATVSHEFRSPLTGIRQLGEMLLAGRAAGDEPRLRRYYELICRESDRLTQLVENLLDFARIEDGRKQYRFERIETGEWLRSLAGIPAERRCVEVQLPKDLPAVEGDRAALSSAVLNLLDNAIKYSPDGAPVGLRASEENGWVSIEVRDRGCGIAPGEQRRIFDRFYRGSKDGGGPARGVGLGLALVKRIAVAHGARIRVESKPGEGSVFYLVLKAVA